MKTIVLLITFSFLTSLCLLNCGGGSSYGGGDSDDPEIKYVFVTSSQHDGDLLSDAIALGYGGADGLEAADYICNDLASDASLTGTYVAWLSSTLVDAKDRLTSAGPWYRVDGITKIADNKADLLDGTIDSPISTDENGNTVIPMVVVFTGTDENGVKDSDEGKCTNWTDIAGNTKAGRGDTVIDEKWSNIAGGLPCNLTNRHLYCFEQ